MGTARAAGRVCAAGLIGCGLFLAPPALAQAVTYTARFERPVLVPGTTAAGGIAWSCAGSVCTASGSWPVPSAGACASLAQVQGRISAYGYPGAALSAEGLVQCNQSAAAQPGAPGSAPVAGVTGAGLGRNQAARDLARRGRTGPLVQPAPPAPPAPPETPPETPPEPPPAPAEPATTPGTRLGLEEGSLGVFRLYVVAPSGISFTGSGPAPAATPVPEPRALLRDGRVSLALRHRAAGPFADGSARGTLPPDTDPAGPAALTVDLELEFTGLPARVRFVAIECAASSVSLAVPAPWSTAHVIGTGRAVRSNATGTITGRVAVPLRLRPYAEASDVAAVQCQPEFVVARASGTGVDRIAGPAVAAGATGGVAGLTAAPGTVSVLRAQANLEAER